MCALVISKSTRSASFNNKITSRWWRNDKRNGSILYLSLKSLIKRVCLLWTLVWEKESLLEVKINSTSKTYSKSWSLLWNNTKTPICSNKITRCNRICHTSTTQFSLHSHLNNRREPVSICARVETLPVKIANAFLAPMLVSRRVKRSQICSLVKQLKTRLCHSLPQRMQS